jgi:hypothetical protein
MQYDFAKYLYLKSTNNNPSAVLASSQWQWKQTIRVCYVSVTHVQYTAMVAQHNEQCVSMHVISVGQFQIEALEIRRGDTITHYSA